MLFFFICDTVDERRFKKEKREESRKARKKTKVGEQEKGGSRQKFYIRFAFWGLV